MYIVPERNNSPLLSVRLKLAAVKLQELIQVLGNCIRVVLPLEKVPTI